MLTRDDIEASYQELGYRHGWTFLCCPEWRLRTAGTVIVGTNPAGGGEGDTFAYRHRWSCEEVADFGFDGGTMGPQVRAWGEALELHWDKVLCAQYIPFRSPDTKKGLPRRAEALAFARRLWSGLLEASPATLFITMGRLPFDELSALINARPFMTGLPTGYQGQTIDAAHGDGGRCLVRMPHPSQFRLFGRGEPSEQARASLRLAAGMEP